MIKNYMKIAWRNLMKSKVFSFINILGLTLGITVCLMIFLFVMNEFSVDNFHANGKNIYRVMRGVNRADQPTPYTSGPYAPALENDFPSDVKRAVRVMPSNDLFVFGDKSFNEKKVYITDPGFFSMFSFPLLKGNAATVLKDPLSVVLTEKTAKKYFGSVDKAMGQVLAMDKQYQLKVTGVAKDVPSNSHMDFDMVLPIQNFIPGNGFENWVSNRLFTYVQLNPNTDVAQLQNKLAPFIEKYMGNDMKQYGFRVSLSLTPLKNIYFESASSFDNVRHGDKKVVYIFLSVAVLILLIACINFMNLSTIRAVERSKEVGLRKVMGALRGNLVWQFIGESVLLTAISCCLSLGLLWLCMPWYNQVLGYSLTISWNTLPLYGFIAGTIIFVGFLAGSYPAFFLSAFSPIQALKGKLRLGKGGSAFREALVVVQFAVSVFLIIGTLVIVRQMNYMKNKQLGYNKEQTIIIQNDNYDFDANKYAFKTLLEGNSNIESVSLMSGEPGGFFDDFSFDVEDHNEIWKARTEFADFEYVKTLGLKIIAGRDFSSRFPTDTTTAALINRTAASKLGWSPEQAVGKWIQNKFRDDNKRRIIGVVEDFNFLSLKETMDALVIAPNPDRRVALIKLRPGNLESGLAAIRTAYSSVAPSYPLEYTFLDQKFGELYRKDLRQQTILTAFACLAIFVACLGLFGLASFAATKRFKEIGVRKVLGSSVQGIVMLLSKNLLKPVLIATCIAIPLGYYAMNTWLQSFAYKTPLSTWIFVIAALATFCIAFITVGIRAVGAAVANPVNSLRNE